MQNKAIQLSEHAKQQIAYRGADAPEIIDAIKSSAWHKAELGRLECRKDFPYNQEWNGKHYATKQVRPIFVDEPDNIIVVTAYVYYF